MREVPFRSLSSFPHKPIRGFGENKVPPAPSHLLCRQCRLHPAAPAPANKGPGLAWTKQLITSEQQAHMPISESGYAPSDSWPLLPTTPCVRGVGAAKFLKPAHQLKIQAVTSYNHY